MVNYYSKVLLFGEHTVINGGQALAIPFKHFFGSWKFTNNDIDRDLAGLADYIDHHDYLFKVIAIDKFFADLDRGLIFESNIPMGFGLGSSGSLVAAVYQRYRSDDGSVNPITLRKHLADLENHFHGKSSGFDPMVSYLEKPILADGKTIRTTPELDLSQKDYQLFLINTNVSRSTEPIVKRFQEYVSITENQRSIDEVYQPAVNSAIAAILDNNYSGLYTNLEFISAYQYAYLDFLIDDGSKKIWKEGLSSNYFKLKICGAGKGGFLLGITTDLNRLQKDHPTREIIPIK